VSGCAGEGGIDDDVTGAGMGDVSKDGDLSREVVAGAIGEANSSRVSPAERWQLGAEAGAESDKETGEAGSGDGAVEKACEMGDRVSSSSRSISRNSSASHLHLAAFRVRLASGEAIAAGEGGRAKGEAVLAKVAAVWGQQLRRWEHVCAASATSLDG
jgi:hypothetical protein